jgi:hypothetical protein
VSTREEWIARHTAEVAKALRSPKVRAEVLAILVGEDERRTRHLAELAQELEEMEVTLKLGDAP